MSIQSTQTRKIRLKDIQGFFDRLPAHVQTQALDLRDLVFSILPPRTKEKFSWQLPFYHYKKDICFINYDSNKQLKLGLCLGFKLLDFQQRLSNETSTVKYFYILPDQPLETQLISDYLEESLSHI